MNRLQWGLASVMAGIGGEGTIVGSPSRGSEDRTRRRAICVKAMKKPREPENLLVHGDNLAALASSGRGSRARSAASTSTRRSTRVEPSRSTTTRSGPQEWVRMMRPRLEALVPLLADDGAVFAEIDDTQLAHLALLMDEVFGAKNRISTITVVRSATTGHKAINAGPVHVSDFILAYAKDKKQWRYRPQVRTRDGLDPAYGTWLDDPDAPPAEWMFRSLRTAIAERSAMRRRAPPSPRSARARSIAAHELALANARHVVRFAQPRYEAIGRAAQAIVDRSRAEPSRVLVLEREGRSPFIVRGGIASCSSGTRSGWSAGARRSSSRSPTCGPTCRSRASRAKAASCSRATRSRAPRRARPRHGDRPGRLGARSVPRQRHDRRRRAQDESPLDRDRVGRSPRDARRAAPRARRRRRGCDRHQRRDRLRRRRLLHGHGALIGR